MANDRKNNWLDNSYSRQYYLAASKQAVRYRTGYKCSGMKLPEVYKLYIRPLFKSSILDSYNRSEILEISPPPLYFIIFIHFLQLSISFGSPFSSILYVIFLFIFLPSYSSFNKASGDNISSLFRNYG